MKFAWGEIVNAVIHHYGWAGVAGLAGYGGVVMWLAKRHRDRQKDR